MKENSLLETLLDLGRKIIPRTIFRAAQPLYHYILALAGAIIYRFPGKQITVIGVTGTKGKSTTTELINKILETAGLQTALANTIRYKIGDNEWRNMFKMTLRGRFFTQRLLRQAVDAGCKYAVIEMSSEAAVQYRHKFLYLDALVFTNLAPEHIESHGSYSNYVNAKIKIAKELERNPKGALIVNTDDKEAERFLELNVARKISYSLHDAVGVKADESGSSFQIEKFVFHSKLPGIFNVYNMLGAIACTQHFGVPLETAKLAIENLDLIRGRMEKIELGQGFNVVVDYAHTPDSLRAVYETYKDQRIIAVLGNTGGGRDTWKRKVMGAIADEYCEEIILTNEDPYDESPRKIVEEVKEGIKNKKVEIIMDRRAAINAAIRKASHFASHEVRDNQNRIAVLITGKGTDPYIMEANGKRTPWDDATVAREELQKILNE